jgi:hypothetical protein
MIIINELGREQNEEVVALFKIIFQHLPGVTE